MRLALSLALDKAGNNMAASMAMMAMTTSNSIKVNPDCLPLPPRRAVFPSACFDFKFDAACANVSANIFLIIVISLALLHLPPSPRVPGRRQLDIGLSSSAIIQLSTGRNGGFDSGCQTPIGSSRCPPLDSPTASKWDRSDYSCNTWCRYGRSGSEMRVGGLIRLGTLLW